jgi:hypothetical protein
VRGGHWRGANNPRWNGGRTTHHSGYILVRAPIDHPHKTKAGYIREHRLVMEQKLGRYLLPSEDVDHLNGDKTDNRPENLQLMTSRSEHLRLEHQRGLYKPNLSRINIRRSACQRGHPYSTETVYLWGGSRHCRTCNAERMRKQRLIKKEQQHVKG